MATPTTLPAAFTAGQVLTAAEQNALRGAFRILQVVSANTSTAVTSSSNVYVDTGLTATITPQSATSKILVILSQGGLEKTSASANSRMDIRLFRGATNILQVASNILFTGTNLQLVGPSVSATYLDSPATTSATTYKTQFMNSDNSASVIVQSQNINASTITLMEISA
jgi:hypothetical protein